MRVSAVRVRYGCTDHHARSLLPLTCYNRLIAEIGGLDLSYSLGHDDGITIEHKSCPVFVDGKECDRPLTLVDLEGKKIARYDLATYECNLRHRTYFLLEPK